MSQVLDQNLVDKIIVNTSDGRKFLCEINNQGQLVIVKELTHQQQTPQQQQGQQGQQGQQPQPQQQQGQPQSGKQAPQNNLGHDGYSVDDIGSGNGGGNVADNVDIKGMKDTVFRSRLSSIMLDNMYDRRLRGSKRGKLDMHHLHKAVVGAKNLFMQKRSRRGKKYNVVLVIDCSGSMGLGSGSRLEAATNVATFLVDSFSGINIDIAVIPFSSRSEVAKKFTDMVNKPEDMEPMLNSIQNIRGGGTNDFSGMKLAIEQLRRRERENNIVMLLSDGESNPERIRTLVKANQDIAKFFGIGIMSNCTQIPENVTIRNIDDMKPEVLKYLKKAIRRG